MTIYPVNLMKSATESFLDALKPFVVDTVTKFYKSIDTTNKVPKRFWAVSLEDLICFLAMIFATVSVWVSVSITGPFSSIIYYWDGPNYVYAAITLYEISKDNPWTKYFKYDPSYFACHLPGFPLIIRFFAFFTLGNYVAADLLAILFCSLLLCYAFRRFLVAYNCVSNPTLTTIMMAFVPMRLLIYHSVGASETLFLSEICFSLIFYKYEMKTRLLFIIWAACITRIEGMAVGMTFGVCYLLRLKIVNAVEMLLTFVAPACLLAFHRAMFGNALAYIDFNQGKQKLIAWPPFNELRGSRISGNDANVMHSFLDFYALYVIGMVLVMVKAGPAGIFCGGILLYVSLLRHLDLYRYAMPVGVFAILVGLDDLWSHPYVKMAMKVVGPFYWSEMMVYAAGQIHSNRCSEKFFNEVLEGAKDIIH